MSFLQYSKRFCTTSQKSISAVDGLILRSGHRIPCIGFGTWGADHFSANEIADSVKIALEIGYRHLDCASVYGNQLEIGQVLNDTFSNGIIKRDELFITSKIWNNEHEPATSN